MPDVLPGVLWLLRAEVVVKQSLGYHPLHVAWPRVCCGCGCAQDLVAHYPWSDTGQGRPGRSSCSWWLLLSYKPLPRSNVHTSWWLLKSTNVDVDACMTGCKTSVRAGGGPGYIIWIFGGLKFDCFACGYLRYNVLLLCITQIPGE